MATDGWFQRWKKWENIVYKCVHQEQNNANAPSSSIMAGSSMAKIITDYSPDDVYNANETGLFYKALPEHSYLFENETVLGCKESKNLVTVLCCVNMSDEKQWLLVIGKSNNQCCFKGIKKSAV